jgi:hypothetical protein
MALTIIDKIKDPTPKWTYKPKPSFKTELEKVKYRELWHQRYREGYQGLSGMHLYYLQECFLKDGADATLIRPRWRDCDEWIINDIHKEFWNPTQALGFIKRREIGLTSIGAGLLPFYTYTMYPNATFGMTSCDKDRIFTAFSDKSQTVMNHLDLDIRPTISRERATPNNVYWELETKVLNQQNQIEIATAKFWSKETAQKEQSASGFSGTRLRAAFFDELPLHPRKELLLRSSRACFMKSNNYSGLLLWGGTVEESLTAEQIQEFQKLVNKSDILNHKVILIPVWWGLIMNKAGESDEKAGMEWHEKEVERLSKSQDTEDDLRAFRMNYPSSWKDIFDLGEGSKWSEDARKKINLRVEQLLTAPPKHHPYDLIETNGEIVAYPASKSNLRILEMPKAGVRYVLAVDATQSTETTSKSKRSSKFSITVMKGVDPQGERQFCPVACYLVRPKDFDDVFDEAIKMLRFWNQWGLAQFCGELNATGGVLAEKMIKAGLKKALIARNKLTKDGNKLTSNLWYYRVDSTIDWQYLHGNTYIKLNWESIEFIELLYDMQKPYGENVDFLDSFLGCIWGFGTGDLLGEQKKKTEVKPQQRTMLTWKIENGRSVEVWVKQ